MNLEYCWKCGDCTEGIGLRGGSIYIDEKGPYCERCAGPLLDSKELIRLRALNAQLVEALKSMFDHFGVDEEAEKDFWHPEVLRASELARSALAAAEKDLNK
jgi:hypothetical protein